MLFTFPKHANSKAGVVIQEREEGEREKDGKGKTETELG